MRGDDGIYRSVGEVLDVARHARGKGRTPRGTYDLVDRYRRPAGCVEVVEGSRYRVRDLSGDCTPWQPIRRAAWEADPT